jgi:hypothetical protein
VQWFSADDKSKRYARARGGGERRMSRAEAPKTPAAVSI